MTLTLETPAPHDPNPAPYTNDDGVRMIQIAPHQFVNANYYSSTKSKPNQRKPLNLLD